MRIHIYAYNDKRNVYRGIVENQAVYIDPFVSCAIDEGQTDLLEDYEVEGYWSSR